MPPLIYSTFHNKQVPSRGAKLVVDGAGCWKAPESRSPPTPIVRHPSTMHARAGATKTMAVLLGLTGAASLRIVDSGVFTISRLLPFENKDAYFVAAPQFGVFDGVSACPQSRAYAQALAKSTSALLSRRNTEAGFAVEAQSALTQAAADASSFSGAATALLVRADLEADEPQVCCYTLGDCGCLVLRPDQAASGSFVVTNSTEPKFHANGAPYQLAGRNFVTDNVADGESFTFPVSS